MNRKKYTEQDLVDFGNYLLSAERKGTIVHPHVENKVNDVDLENWKKTVVIGNNVDFYGDVPVGNVFEYKEKKYVVVDDSGDRTAGCPDCCFKEVGCDSFVCVSDNRSDGTTVIFTELGNGQTTGN